MTVTTYTVPSEIRNIEDATEFLRRWERLLAGLPKSAPKKIRKGCVERVVIARALVHRYEA